MIWQIQREIKIGLTTKRIEPVSLAFQESEGLVPFSNELWVGTVWVEA